MSNKAISNLPYKAFYFLHGLKPHRHELLQGIASLITGLDF